MQDWEVDENAGDKVFALLVTAMVAFCGMAEAARSGADTERSAMLREIPFSSIGGSASEMRRTMRQRPV